MKKIIIMLLALLAIGIVSAYTLVIRTDVPVYLTNWMYRYHDYGPYYQCPNHNGQISHGVYTFELTAPYYRFNYSYFSEITGNIRTGVKYLDFSSTDVIEIVFKGKLDITPIEPVFPPSGQ